MKLSENQQRAVWRQLDAAWKAHAAREGIRENDSVAKTAFRKRVLRESTGLASLTLLPKAGPLFAKFMAALEVIAGDGIKWNVHVDSGEAARACPLHALGALMVERGISPAYVTGIARRACRDERMELHDLDAAQAETVLRIVRAQLAAGKVATLSREVAA